MEKCAWSIQLPTGHNRQNIPNGNLTWSYVTWQKVTLNKINNKLDPTFSPCIQVQVTKCVMIFLEK